MVGDGRPGQAGPAGNLIHIQSPALKLDGAGLRTVGKGLLHKGPHNGQAHFIAEGDKQGPAGGKLPIQFLGCGHGHIPPLV